MKKLFKWVFRLLLGLIVLAGLLVLARNVLSRSLAEKYLREATGMDAVIGRIHIGVQEPVITLENFRLMNPPELGGRPFLDLPELRVEYDLAGLFSRQVRLRSLRLYFEEVHIVRNKEGQHSWFTLLDHVRQRHAVSSVSRAPWEFHGVDTLTLSLGRFKYVDYLNPVQSQEVWLGLRDLTAKDLRTAKDVEALLARVAKEKGINLAVLDRAGAPTNRPSESAVRSGQSQPPQR